MDLNDIAIIWVIGFLLFSALGFWLVIRDRSYQEQRRRFYQEKRRRLHYRRLSPKQRHAIRSQAIRMATRRAAIPARRIQPKPMATRKTARAKAQNPPDCSLDELRGAFNLLVKAPARY